MRLLLLLLTCLSLSAAQNVIDSANVFSVANPGGVQRAFDAINSNFFEVYNATSGRLEVTANTTSGTNSYVVVTSVATVTLPRASNVNRGFSVLIRAVGAVATVAPDGSWPATDTIELSGSSVTIASGQAAWFFSSGTTNWEQMSFSVATLSGDAGKVNATNGTAVGLTTTGTVTNANSTNTGTLGVALDVYVAGGGSIVSNVAIGETRSASGAKLQVSSAHVGSTSDPGDNNFQVDGASGFGVAPASGIAVIASSFALGSSSDFRGIFDYTTNSGLLTIGTRQNAVNYFDTIQLLQRTLTLQGSLVVGTNTTVSNALTVIGNFKLASSTNSTAGGGSTSNTPKGQNKIASGAGSLILTNTLINAGSMVIANLGAADGVIQCCTVTPGSGTATLTTSANLTADRVVNWIIVNDN